MPYKDVLKACADPVVGCAVFDAVETLFKQDRKLLEKDVHERTIAAKLAEYLQPHFPKLNVNVEYDLMGDVLKRLAWNGGDPDRVLPDIIVHVIGEPVNVLVVEIKKDSNPVLKDDDIRKLRAFREDPNFRYRHALFMRFGVGEGAATISECEWV